MSGLTPERVREAAEICDHYAEYRSAEYLRDQANRLEREAGRGRAIESLAKWLYIHIGTSPQRDEWDLMVKPNIWHDRAEELVTAFPVILES